MVKGSTLEVCRRIVTLPIEANLTTRILHSIKVIVATVSIKQQHLYLAVVTEMSAKNLGLAGS